MFKLIHSLAVLSLLVVPALPQPAIAASTEMVCPVGWEATRISNVRYTCYTGVRDETRGPEATFRASMRRLGEKICNQYLEDLTVVRGAVAPRFIKYRVTLICGQLI